MIQPGDEQFTGHKEMLALKAAGQIEPLKRNALTGFCGDDPVVCGGLVEMWPGRGTLWAILDRRITPNIFLSIHRSVVKLIDDHLGSTFHRLELAVLHDFKNGHRWAETLGFEWRCDLPKYDQWQRDYVLYERLK